MKKIKCLIIDDELHNCELLKSMLVKYCPETEVCGTANSAEQAYELCAKLNPDLVFLDVKMPGKNGFDFLRSFKEIPFKIIFVTGFDEYAIQAFEFSAIDYILKPIDYTKLIKAVDKVFKLLENEAKNNVVHFIQNYDEKNQILKTISLHHQDKVHLINLIHVSYIEALRGYSEVYTTDNKRYISAKSLTDYEILLKPFPNFVRINKSEIININEISEYTKGSDCFISLRNTNKQFEVSRRKKTEIIQLLKQE